MSERARAAPKGGSKASVMTSHSSGRRPIRRPRHSLRMCQSRSEYAQDAAIYPPRPEPCFNCPRTCLFGQIRAPIEAGARVSAPRPCSGRAQTLGGVRFLTAAGVGLAVRRRDAGQITHRRQCVFLPSQRSSHASPAETQVALHRCPTSVSFPCSSLSRSAQPREQASCLIQHSPRQ